jgi:hypothetical protein
MGSFVSEINCDMYTHAHMHIGTYLHTCIFLICYFVVLGFELRALYLLDRCNTREPHHKSFFALVIFQIGSHVFCPGPASNHNLLPTYASQRICTFLREKNIFVQYESVCLTGFYLYEGE